MNLSKLLNVTTLTIIIVSVFMGTSVAVTSEDPLVRQALQSHWGRSGLLLELPYAFAYGAGGSVILYPASPNAFLLWLDLDQSEPGNQQTILVVEGATVTVTGEWQLWGRPGEIRQLFAAYSWTPSWPPHGYTHPLYNGGVSTWPGQKQTFSFNVTVPTTPGVYYLYFCTEAHYNMYDAVDQFVYPMWAPYAVISVGGLPY